MAVGATETKESTGVQSATPSSTSQVTQNDPQKAEITRSVAAKSDADAGRIADRIVGSGDTIQVAARSTVDAAAIAPIAANANVVAANANVVAAGVDAPAIAPVAATTDAPATAPDAVYDDAYRAIDEMGDRQWMADENAAREQAARVRDIAAALPAADRTEFLAQAMDPVHQFIRGSGLVDPSSGNPGVDPTRAAIVGQFADLIGQTGVDELGNVLRNNADDPVSRNLVLGTLGQIATGPNRDENVRSSAAKTIFAGPLEGLRDGLAGNIPGLSVENLGELTDRYGDLQSDQRLLAASNGLDPGVRASLEARGLREATMFPDNAVFHDALDYAGLAPGLGTIADGINAFTYALEGRPGEAATTMLPSVLGAGVTVGRVVDAATSLGTSLATRAQRFGLHLGRDQGLVYERFSKHPVRDPDRSIDSYGRIAPAPRDGQFGLDTSVEVSQRTRISADPLNREFNVFNLTGNNVWHGHARTWDLLDNDMRGRLIQMGIVDRRGRFLVTE